MEVVPGQVAAEALVDLQRVAVVADRNPEVAVVQVALRVVVVDLEDRHQVAEAAHLRHPS